MHRYFDLQYSPLAAYLSPGKVNISAPSVKKISVASCVIMYNRGIGVSQVSLKYLLVSFSVIGASSFPPGDSFGKATDNALYAPNLP